MKKTCINSTEDGIKLWRCKANLLTAKLHVHLDWTNHSKYTVAEQIIVSKLSVVKQHHSFVVCCGQSHCNGHTLMQKICTWRQFSENFYMTFIDLFINYRSCLISGDQLFKKKTANKNSMLKTIRQRCLHLFSYLCSKCLSHSFIVAVVNGGDFLVNFSHYIIINH